MKRKIVAVFLTATMLGLFSSCSQSVSGESQEAMVDAVQEDTEEQSAEVTMSPEESSISDRSEDVDTSAPVAKGSRIAVIAKSTKDEYWKAVKEGMKDAVSEINKAYGYKDEDKITMTFEGPDDEQKVTDQINTIDAVLSENPTVLCLSAIDADSCEAQLETAHENGIPVVTFDSGLNSGLPDGICTSGNGKIGKIAATKLAEKLGSQGKVAIIAHSELGQSSVTRVTAFQKFMRDFPGIEVLDPVYDSEGQELSDVVQQLLDTNSDLAGIFCTNGAVSDVVLDCVQNSKRQDIAIVGVDGTTAQQEAVKSGREVGFVAQNPYEIGYQTILEAIKAAEPGDLEDSEKHVWVKSQWIDSQNIKEFENTKYLL